jgi:S1-C subfamily serine protease
MSKRTMLVSSILLLLVLVLSFLALQHRESKNGTGPSRRSRGVSLRKTLRYAVADPVNFTKKQFQGGIGITLVPQTGLPVIGSVLAESPAHRAGILEGDTILKVNGVLTTNKPPAQVASEIKGITAGFVTLTVQRNGSNCEYTIQRSSWNNLEQRNLR